MTPYFDSWATNPLELAKKNLEFYKWFVEDYGYNPLYRDLWPGEKLRAFIRNFMSYARNSISPAIKEQAAELFKEYRIVYRNLTGYDIDQDLNHYH